MDTPTTRAVLEAWFAAMSAGDGEAIFAALADDVVLEIPATEHGEPISWAGRWAGKDELRRAFALRAEHLDALEFEPLTMIVEGDRAVAFSRERNRNRSSGEVYDLEICQVIRVRDGGIVHIRALDDSYPPSRDIPS